VSFRVEAGNNQIPSNGTLVMMMGDIFFTLEILLLLLGFGGVGTSVIRSLIGGERGGSVEERH